MQILTASRLRCFRECPRKHHYRYDLGFRPVEDAHALRYGTLVHRALEAWWSDEHGRFAAAMRVLRKAEAAPLDRARAEAMLAAYHERWHGDMRDIEVVAVEREFAMPLVNPATGRPSRTWSVAGKIDALARIGKDLWLVEHKTTSEDISVGAPYWARLRMDMQVSIYMLGAETLGYGRPVGVLYDVLRKPAHRLRKDENPETFRSRVLSALQQDLPRYFQRQRVVRLEDELREALSDLWLQAVMLRQYQLAGVHPRNPEACQRFGRCEYFDVCTGAASLEDPALFRRAERQHEELGDAV